MKRATILALLAFGLFLGNAAWAQTAPIGAVRTVTSAAAEKSHVLKSTPGYLLSISVAIGATNGWLLLYDATAAPSDGAVTPLWCTTVVGNATLGSLNLIFETPLRFPSNGIVAVFSSTGCFTQTGSNAAFSAQVM